MSMKYYHHNRRGLKLLPIAVLLIVTPLLSSSLRLKYLYFIVNILIIAVGAEAGLLSFLLQSADIKEERFNIHDHGLNKPVKACVEEKVKEAERLLSLISNPVDIFFIGSGGGCGDGVSTAENTIIVTRGDDHEVLVMEEDYHLDDHHSHVVDGEELFRKAEMFIGNFYKQVTEVRMQKEENKDQVRL